ncbi:CLUMA_CG010932, isoform A [Clunio marinus]|uniref:CLUMA_CG010932, isoform A n=1 Tax=Clunio marinus TaxID=568069 RepID=A0A1J1IB74_9DIPT|nr:CLUMA_CG010932, isoform A [Clunio marinus]
MRGEKAIKASRKFISSYNLLMRLFLLIEIRGISPLASSFSLLNFFLSCFGEGKATDLKSSADGFKLDTEMGWEFLDVN